MKLKMFIVKDIISSTFDYPCMFENIQTAKRAFSVLIARNAQFISDHIDDKDVYCLGEFDNETGQFFGNANAEFAFHLNESYEMFLEAVAKQQKRADKFGLERELTPKEVADNEAKEKSA